MAGIDVTGDGDPTPNLALAASLDLTNQNIGAGATTSGSVASLPPQPQPHHTNMVFGDGTADSAADDLFGASAGSGAAAASASTSAAAVKPAPHAQSAPVRDVKLDSAPTTVASSKSDIKAATAAATAASQAAAAAAAAEHAGVSHRHLLGANGKRRFEVSVSDPEKKGEGGFLNVGAHTTYKINTTKETSPGKFSQSSVVRRFNDFVWLHAQLSAKYRGFLIPPVPEKQLIGNLEAAFVNERKRALENFLTRIACHPELSAAPDVELMLHGDDETLNKAKAGQIVPTSAGPVNAAAAGGKAKPAGAAGVWSMFKDVAQTVQTAVAGGGKPREPSKDDVECESVRTYAEALEKDLVAVDLQATNLMNDKAKLIATGWFEFGLACTLCAGFESKNGEKELGTCFAKLGAASDKLSVLLATKKESETVHCLELFRDYVRVVKSVQAMIAIRNKVLASYHSALSSLESLQAETAKLAANPAKKAQVADKEKQVTAAQALVDRELAELKLVTSNALGEAQRFRIEKLRDLKHVIVEFVKTQIDHANKVKLTWEAVLSDIDTLAS